MFKKNLALGASAAVLTAFIAVPSLAYGLGHGTEGEGPRGPRGPEDRAAMIEAIESGDYAAWSELMGDRPHSDLVTEDNFDRFVEMSRLFHEGDVEGANAIREELGLPDRGLHRGRMMQGKGPGFGQHRGWGKGEGNGPRFEDRNGDGYCDRLDLED